MGYFSRLACELACREDRSYPSPEMQLICRIRDLEGRLAELSEVGFVFSDDRLSAQEIETALPEHLFREKDLRTALSIAKRQLMFMESGPGTINEGSSEAALPDQIKFDIKYTIHTNIPMRAA